MYFDLDGTATGKNFSTGDSIEIKYMPRKWNQLSKLQGSVKNSNGKVMYEIMGSWLDEIKVKNMSTGQV